MKKPTLQQKVGAAVFVATFGAEHTGIATTRHLMWPHENYTDNHVRKEAATLLCNVHTALLEAMPLQRSEQIWKDQAERLTFVLG